MDFLDPNKKRRNRIKLYTGYGLMAILIGIATSILLLAASGYGLDGSGKVIQNGLVFVNSRPGAAAIYVEGIHNKFKQQAQTDTRLVLKEGRYKLTLVKDGYRSWQREFSLEGGTVERFAYPFLFPENIQTQDVKTYSSMPRLVTQSPSREWIVIQQPDRFDTFDVFNANDPDRPPASFTIPANILSPTQGEQSLELVEWSTDNANILLKHTFDDQHEFVVINREKPEESFNITARTNQRPFDVSLKDKKTNKLYLHMSKDGLLQEIDLSSGVLTPLVGRAFAFKPHGDDMVVYVSPHATKSDKASVRLLTKEKDYELRELSISPSYVVDVARFDNAWYVVAGASNDNQVFVYKNPLEVLTNANPKKLMFARTLRIDNPQAVSFSANARIIAVQSGQSFAVYDAETDRQYRYTISDQFDSSRPAEWMDGHRLLTSTEKTAYVFDFDGINSQKLIATDPSTDMMFDRDYELSYNVTTKDDGGVVFKRGKLLNDN